MFISLSNKFFINTDKIEVIASYSRPTEIGCELGVVINGNAYAIYKVEGQAKPEILKELEDNIKSILEDVVSSVTKQIHTLEIPSIDLSKYYEKEEPKKVEKETLND